LDSLALLEHPEPEPGAELHHIRVVKHHFAVTCKKFSGTGGSNNSAMISIFDKQNFGMLKFMLKEVVSHV